jgi:haloalkane dehalogenase
MSQIFIELFNYADKWYELPALQRQFYREGVLRAIELQRALGIRVIGWGFNDVATDKRAPYDFYSVYEVTSVQVQRQFEEEIATAGWYDFFEQVNVSGRISTPEELFETLVAAECPKAC